MNVIFFFFKQKTAYELRISDWSSDVCSSDLIEISRLRTENSKLSAKLTQPLEDIETAAIAIAMNRLRHCRPPVRWPAGPEDRLSGRDGTVPITWDAAEQYREDAAVALGAIPDRKSTRLNSSH